MSGGKPLKKDRAYELAEEHWQYVERLLDIHYKGPTDITIIEFHYRSAFVHGYKHAKEDKRR